ncbi:Uncharacterised protein [Bordetella pertussis]|nr:Uncharacterised protein [Bordetella pertussis]
MATAGPAGRLSACSGPPRYAARSSCVARVPKTCHGFIDIRPLNIQVSVVAANSSPAM